MGAEGHAISERLHDGPLQLLGAALLKTEMCEQLIVLNRGDELPARLAELRAALEQAAIDLRSIMVDARRESPQR